MSQSHQQVVALKASLIKQAEKIEHIMFTLTNSKRVQSAYYYHAYKTCLPKNAIGNISTELANLVDENNRNQ